MSLDIAIGQRWISWHVGQDMPINGGLSTHDIKYVSADGDELEKIRAEITGVPMSNKGIVSWFGDDAKFIVANLNY